MKEQVLTQKNFKNVRNILFTATFLVTIYFKTDVQDPFNSPKMWILLLASAWAIGWIFLNFSIIKNNHILQKLSLFTTLFILSMLMAAIRSDNINKAFFGEYQRRNGFLTYLGMTVILLSTAMLVRLINYTQLLKLSILTGTFVGIYGIFQHFGIDFVNWDNNYNSIIGTLGNPNFASALMAILVVIIIGPVFQPNFSNILRVLCLLLTSLLFIVILFSKARQGLISMFVGIFVFLAILIYTRNKIIGVIFISVGSLISLMSILGMLQIGPLTYWLYKSSVSVRGYYWRAGLEMLNTHPLFGIGIDNYGNFFKQYREMNYSLTYGMEITSTNAHNTPIQFFATGGYPLGLTYLILVFYVFYVSVKGIKNSAGEDRLIKASIFSAWLAFHAQSIISIDNIGISIWGYLLSGVLIGINISDSDNKMVGQNRVSKKLKASTRDTLQPVISLLFFIPIFVLVLYLNKSENLLFMVRNVVNPTVQENNIAVKNLSDQILNRKFIDNITLVEISNYLARSGYSNEAIQVLELTNKNDPRNIDALNYLAFASDSYKKYEDAIQYRLQIYKLDPWDAENLLKLGRNYKQLNNFSEMNKILEKIIGFAPETSQAKQAIIELVS